eukprot:g5713.t1
MGPTTLTLQLVAVAVVTLAATAAAAFEAFVPPLRASGVLAPMTQQRQHANRSGHRRTALGMKYVPDGLSPEQWKKMQKEEAEKKKKMGNLGEVGVKSFKSRSFQSWQESGGKHLFPVDPKKVKSGEISADKTPYMQRKGAWDNSDLAKKDPKIAQKKWTKADKAYAAKPPTAAEKKAAAAKAAADKKNKGKGQAAATLKPEETKKGLFGLW